MVPGGEARVQTLEGCPHLGQSARDFRRDVGHRRAAARLHRDEALAREHAQRLADRDARDAELLRQAVFDQAVAGTPAIGEDRAAQLFGDTLAEREMLAPERAAGAVARFHFGMITAGWTTR